MIYNHIEKYQELTKEDFEKALYYAYMWRLNDKYSLYDHTSKFVLSQIIDNTGGIDKSLQERLVSWYDEYAKREEKARKNKIDEIIRKLTPEEYVLLKDYIITSDSED